MKLDGWTRFMLNLEDQQLIQAFASPDYEASFIKDVPIGALDQVRPVLKRIRNLTGRKTHVMFRGQKNRYHGQACVWKQDANRFAVYFR